MTSIVSFNINGFRSVVEKGILEWIAQHDFDIICFQETKIRDGRIPKILIDSFGYHHDWHHAERPGYSGVATFSKQRPKKVFAGTGIQKYDLEGRVLQSEFADFTVLNCYVPSGSSSDVRHQFKMQFLDDFYGLVDNLLLDQRKIIILGDFNIAHTEKDLHDPNRNKNSSGFLPKERQWMTQFFQLGMNDSLRHKYPDKVAYSWWHFAGDFRNENKGWRLDYIAVSDDLLDRVHDLKHMKDVTFSDHCPIVLELADS